MIDFIKTCYVEILVVVIMVLTVLLAIFIPPARAFVDKNGCEYLINNQSGHMVPRLDENGKPICIKK